MIPSEATVAVEEAQMAAMMNEQPQDDPRIGAGAGKPADGAGKGARRAKTKAEIEQEAMEQIAAAEQDEAMRQINEDELNNDTPYIPD
jgi:hypothetical protein